MKIIHFSVVVFLIGCVHACASLDAQTPVRKQLLATIDEGLAIMKRQPTDPSQKIQQARDLLDHAGQYDALIPSLYQHQDRSSAIGSQSRERQFAALTLFQAADECKQAGKPQCAVMIYRSIIATYSGSAWQGYRDRARMELDALK